MGGPGHDPCLQQKERRLENRKRGQVNTEKKMTELQEEAAQGGQGPREPQEAGGSCPEGRTGSWAVDLDSDLVFRKTTSVAAGPQGEAICYGCLRNLVQP